jgi:uncharacterized protein with FMN-binding domain
MRLVALVAAALIVSLPASAQTWKSYSYPESGLSFHLPADPKIEDGTYTTMDGKTVKARIYSLEHENILYAVTVADFSQERMEDDAAIDQAVKQLIGDGEVLVDIPHRINSTYGRQLSIKGKDDSRASVAVFFRDKKLYVANGKLLAAHPDKGTGEGARFQQTLGWE